MKIANTNTALSVLVEEPADTSSMDGGPLRATDANELLQKAKRVLDGGCILFSARSSAETARLQ